MSRNPAVCSMTSDTFKLDSDHPGHRGGRSWVFEAVRAGECNIELRYQRPWANAALPERLFQIFIHVENPERGAEAGHY
jgi:predicted secreted protein